MAISNMAVDLGSSTVRISMSGKGVVVKEPAIMAVNNKTKLVVGVGKNAYNMMGKTGNDISFYRPFENGIVTDFTMAEYFVTYYMKKIGIGKFMLPNASIAVPFDINDVQKKAVYNVFERSGFRKIRYITNSMAGFKGASLNIKSSTAIMLVSIGFTYTCATIMIGGKVVSRSKIKLGGDDFTKSLIKYVMSKYGLEIGYQMAEEIKEEIGSVYQKEKPTSYHAQGKNLMTGLPDDIIITSKDTVEAFAKTMFRISKSIEESMEFLSPEIFGDIARDKIVLIGGTAKMNGIDKVLEMHLNCKVEVAENPENIIIDGIV